MSADVKVTTMFKVDSAFLSSQLTELILNEAIIQVRGHLSNTGHSVVFIVDTGSGTFNNDGPGNIKQNFSAAAREKDESRSPFETDKEREGRKTSGGHFNSEEGGRDSSSSGPFDRMPQDALMTGHRRTTENDVRHGRFDNAHVDADVSHRKEKIVAVNIIGGPLSYKYQVSHIQFHFGTGDGPGSEHTVNGSAFRAEMQVYGFNAQLYNNFSEAVTRPHGAAAIAVLIQVGVRGHPGLSSLMDALPRVRWAGEAVWVSSVSINDVLPHTQHYMTYEGSLTQPPCHETVTWIVMNKPVYVTRIQLSALQQLQTGRRGLPQARLLSNFRPTQRLYHRTLSTNIDFTNSDCRHPTGPTRYAANTF
ncbi:Alpha carbonic anhydrase [Trinorchestia longiramus]|nr:Alpha carbonic anhydrase [Trinorchestia longiramus]